MLWTDLETRNLPQRSCPSLGNLYPTFQGSSSSSLFNRPEPYILTGFRLPLLAKATEVLVLHQVALRQVDSDVRLFFRCRLSGLARRRRFWMTGCQRNMAVNFIDHGDNDPKWRLNLLLQGPESSAREGRTKFDAKATLDSRGIHRQ